MSRVLLYTRFVVVPGIKEEKERSSLMFDCLAAKGPCVSQKIAICVAFFHPKREWEMVHTELTLCLLEFFSQKFFFLQVLLSYCYCDNGSRMSTKALFSPLLNGSVISSLLFSCCFHLIWVSFLLFRQKRRKGRRKRQNHSCRSAPIPKLFLKTLSAFPW